MRTEPDHRVAAVAVPENTTVPETTVPATGLLIGVGEQQAVARVLASGHLAQGTEVAGFEAEFAEHVGGRPCVAVNSGTSALLLGLMALGVGRGDEVIVPSFSFAATANAVVLAGATPVFADIEPHHFGIDPEAVRAAVTRRTAAVVPVHLYGHPAAMVELTALAARYGLAVVEDAAQAHLAALAGRPVGTWGAAAAFSFYPTKNMTCGEGGMVVCEDGATARRVRLLRNQGMERRYENEVPGFNMRMSDVHAAIGRVQLRHLPGWTDARRANARYLTAGLATAGLRSPSTAPGAEPVWHQYTVRVGDRGAVVARLDELGVGTGVYYPTPIHRLAAYDLDLDLPRTEAAAREVLSLPVHPALTAGQRDRVVAAVHDAVGRSPQVARIPAQRTAVVR
jgi:dTDP-4-amino-4,6-dideoxygalactose transaminase